MNKRANRWGKIGENFNLLVVDSEGKIRNIKACGCHLKSLKRENKIRLQKEFLFSVMYT